MKEYVSAYFVSSKFVCSDFSNITPLCVSKENGVSEQLKTLGDRARLMFESCDVTEKMD